MIKISLASFILCLILFSGCKTTKDVVNTDSPLYTVTGSIYVTSDYCGGAHPTEDILNKLKTPKPYTGKKIYIRSGKENNTDSPILYSLVTDDAGKFTANLPDGDYCIVDEYQINNGFADSLLAGKVPNLKITDELCIQQWLLDGVIKFKVDKGGITLPQINIHKQCFRPDGVPCLTYTGELPK